jgi:hypothetical protein
MFIHEDTIKWALESLKNFDSAAGIKLNRYIGLIALAKNCGEAVIPLKTYPVLSSKLTDSINDTFTIVSSRPSTSDGVIYLTFGANWHEDGVKNFLKSQRPPLLQLAIVCLRNKDLVSATAEGLLSDFISSYNIPRIDADKLSGEIQIKTASNPVSNSKFIEISEGIFGVITASKRTYTPSGFVVSAAGEIDRGPYTQPLLNQAEIFGIIKMTRSSEQSVKQHNTSVTTSPPPERNAISSGLISALAAKPFVILAGGTGTGKTRSARQVAIQIAGKENVSTVAVGADWTDNRPLLGFRNLLSPDGASYVAPEALKLILKADKNLRDAAMETEGENSAGSPIEESVKPFFLILDEMNLSHVERYFADFLSSMESGEALKLHDYEEGLKADGVKNDDGTDLIVPHEVEWPRNLFVIGTVNIDETTYMFSPKVLDRAHVIEFKVKWNEIKTGLSFPPAKALASWSTEQTHIFTSIALDDPKVLEKADQESLEDILAGVYGCLDGTRYSFAHRTARECLNYVAAAQRLSEAKLIEHREMIGLIDLAILQKALPKLNGSAGSLTETLNKLSEFTTKHALKECSEKLSSMVKQLKNDQFVSFIQ